jgi:cytochrome c oxidase subunit 3/cytochrome o ubiquinol oxidase subunit 3
MPIVTLTPPFDADRQGTPFARGRVGMYCLIAAEAAMFTIFLVAYLFYDGKSPGGPTPQEALQVPVILTLCLLWSSASIHLAVRSWKRGSMSTFAVWWVTTLVLGTVFLAGTGLEWHRLIHDEHLTIATNLFGTTYYALVGLHALHVTVGLFGLAVVSALALLGHVRREHAAQGEVLSLYWHFVDGVWVVVFTVVYVIGR